jgi:hypothetical protein|nr:MAG TPA: hypothetical protein [Caudoviricetes sp.]
MFVLWTLRINRSKMMIVNKGLLQKEGGIL